jgi:hypothetical protein
MNSTLRFNANISRYERVSAARADVSRIRIRTMVGHISSSEPPPYCLDQVRFLQDAKDFAMHDKLAPGLLHSRTIVDPIEAMPLLAADRVRRSDRALVGVPSGDVSAETHV